MFYEQCLQNRVVAGVEACAVYLDDVVVFKHTLDERLDHIIDLFLHWAQNPSNCQPCENEV